MFNNISPLTMGIKKERDPIFTELEQKVFLQLHELTKDDIQTEKTKSISFVSFEEAIKELVEFRKKNH